MNTKYFSFSIWKNKLFSRILFSFLSLLLPIIIIGAIFYVNSINKQKEDFSDKIQLNLHASADTIDLYLQTIQETSMSFFFDDSVQNILMPYDQYTIQERVSLRKISNVLSRIRSITTDYVDQIFVYIDDNQIYTSNGMENFGIFFEKFYKFDRYDSAYWKRINNSGSVLEYLEPSKVTASESSRTVVPFIIRSVVKGNNAVIVTTIAASNLMRTLKNNSMFDSTEYIILDHQKRLVLTSNERLYEAIDKESISRENKSSEIQIGGKKYMVIPQKSSQFGWQYFSITPIEEFGNYAKELITALMIICIVFVVIGIIVSFIFTFNLYTPIKKIRDVLLAQDNSNDYLRLNELDFIGVGVHQLIRNNQKLNAVTKEYLDNAMIHLIQGNLLPNDEEVERILSEKFGFTGSSYLCCNIKFDFTEQFYSELQEIDRIVIRGKLQKLVWGMLSKYVHTFVLNYSDHLYVCVVNMESKDRMKLNMALDGLSEVFRYDSKYCIITIGLGNPYSGLEGIIRSHGDAMTAIEHRESDGSSFQIINSADLLIINHHQYSFADENKLINALKLGNWDHLESLIETIIQENKRNGVSHRNMNLLISEIFQTGQKFAKERGLDVTGILLEDELYYLTTPPEMLIDAVVRKQQLLRFYQKIIQIVSDQKVKESTNESGRHVTELMKYIEEHYNEDLYLEKLSSQFGLSTKYISRSFKEKTGTNLSDFISQVRIEKAKTLLRENTDMSVSAIAEQVGIYSRMTFLRLFKKQEGIAPNEFREICRKGKVG